MVQQFISEIFKHTDAIYEIATKNNFYIIEENLGEQIAGYLNCSYGNKLIHVNSEMPSCHKKFVIASFLYEKPNKRTHNDSISFISMHNLHNLAQQQVS